MSEGSVLCRRVLCCVGGVLYRFVGPLSAFCCSVILLLFCWCTVLFCGRLVLFCGRPPVLFCVRPPVLFCGRPPVLFCGRPPVLFCGRPVVFETYFVVFSDGYKSYTLFTQKSKPPFTSK